MKQGIRAILLCLGVGGVFIYTLDNALDKVYGIEHGALKSVEQLQTEHVALTNKRVQRRIDAYKLENL